MADQDPENETSPTDDEDGDGERTFEGEYASTAVVKVDQEKVQEKRQELGEKVQSEELTPQEADDEMVEFQQGLAQEGITTIEGEVGDLSGLSIVESDGEYGLLLLDGSAEQMMELLSLEAVDALLASGRYDEYTQAA